MRKGFVYLLALSVLAAPASNHAGLAERRELVGVASWYGGVHHGRTTASGEVFDMHALTAAHKDLPFGTRLRVTDLESGRSVVVRVNDRGPYMDRRAIDLSYGAARKLGIVRQGLAHVRLEPLAQTTW